MIYTIALILIILFVIVSALNPYKIRKTRNKGLAPIGYRLFYTDQNTERKKPKVIYKKLLFSEKYNIQGKPDFIYKMGKKYYPIELKSGNIKDKPLPHRGDLLQLGAYFLIIEDLYGYRPKKGKLIYNDYAFFVKNSRKLRREVLKTVNEMRTMLKTGNGVETCSFSHCRYCMYKDTVCEFYKNL